MKVFISRDEDEWILYCDALPDGCSEGPGLVVDMDPDVYAQHEQAYMAFEESQDELGKIWEQAHIK